MKKTLLKKLDIAVLLASMIIALAACGGGNKTAATSESKDAVETTIETAEETSEAVVSDEGTSGVLYEIDGPGVLAGTEFERALNKYELFITRVERSDKHIFIEAKRELVQIDGTEELRISVENEEMDIVLYTNYYTNKTGSVQEHRAINAGSVKVGDPTYWGFLEEEASKIGSVIKKWRYDSLDDYSLEAERTGYVQNGASILFRSLSNFEIQNSIFELNHILDGGLIISAVSIDEETSELQLYTDFGGFIIFNIVTGEAYDGDNNHIASGYRTTNSAGFDVLKFEDGEIEKVLESLKSLEPKPEEPTLF